MDDKNLQDRKEKIKQFIIDTFLYDREDIELTYDYELIGEVIDSMGIFQLISFIDEEFGVTVEPENMVIENFATINEIALFISQK